MPNRYRNVVGPQVRKIRNLHGWSQAEFAAKCQMAGWDVTRDIIATIEARSRWVGDFELILLSRVLSVPLTELLPGHFHEALQLIRHAPDRGRGPANDGK